MAFWFIAVASYLGVWEGMSTGAIPVNPVFVSNWYGVNEMSTLLTPVPSWKKTWNCTDRLRKQLKQTCVHKGWNHHPKCRLTVLEWTPRSLLKHKMFAIRVISTSLIVHCRISRNYYRRSHEYWLHDLLMLFCLEVLVVMPLLRITRLMLLLLMHLQKKIKAAQPL